MNKTKDLAVSVTPREQQALVQLAKREGLNLSEYLHLIKRYVELSP